MGTCQWGFTLVIVALLLLDPTFADVLVQPGYGQPGHVQKNSVAPQSQSSSKDQPVGNTQQNYSPQQNYPPQQSPIQLLQQQHLLQQKYLQYQHQQEHNQLVQLQQQQLQDPALRQSQTGGNEVVGMPYGLPILRPFTPGPFGGLAGSRLFSLGPFGVNSFTLGGLGGHAPLLLSPHQQPQMTGSPQFQKSLDGPTQPRDKREVRDAGESSGRKYRKNSRSQQDGVATNSPLNSKSDATSQNVQTSSKSNDDTVGSTNKENGENVGSSLLDPLGLVEKTEDLIEGLKSGHLPDPLRGLGHGGYSPGHNSWLNKQNNAGNSQFEEHVVGKSNEYNNMNQQRSQIVGDPRHPSYPYYARTPTQPGHFGKSMPYGTYSQTYPSFPQTWMREANSMYNQGNGMAYRGSPIIGAGNPTTQQSTTRGNNPMTLSQNPNERSNAYEKQMIGSQNPALTNTKMTAQKTDNSGQSLINDRMVGAQNPSQSSPKQTSWSNPGGYNQMIGNPPNQLGSFYQTANTGQPMLGTLYDPVTGSSGPAALNGGGTPFNYPTGGPDLTEGRNSMVGNPLINNFYDQNRQNYYRGSNGGWQRHNQLPFGLDELFDDGYNGYHHHHHHHGGGLNRIYDTVYDDSPYGYGGGNPHYFY